MRTTLDIPDALYREVRAKSALNGSTLRAVTITLYTDWLASKPAPQPAVSKRRSLPDWAGLCAGHIKVDPNRKTDMASIRESIGRGIAAERV